MYMLEVAKEHQADLEAAANGASCQRVRHSRQHHGEGLWIIAAVRDLVVGCGTRRCCPARNETSGDRGRHRPRYPSWDLAGSGGLPIAIDPIAADMGLATTQMAVSPEFRTGLETTECV